MSTSLPIRALRLPLFHRQCLFLRRQVLDRPPLCPTRAFSTTPPRLARTAKSNQKQDKAMTKAAAQHGSGPAPRVNLEKAQQEAGMMAVDIGLLQGTVVRASLSNLPAFYRLEFWGYLWTLTKSKVVAWYTRWVYYRYIDKSNWWRYFWLIDGWSKKRLGNIAKTHYKSIYAAFAQGDMVPIQKVCLEPLSRDFKDRLAARGPTTMKWTCENLSARVVSHRAAPLGDGHPNTAYRQVVFRLSSDQRLLVSGTGWASLSSSSTVSTAGKPRWVPGEAKVKPDTEKNVVHQRTPFVDNGSSAKLTKVVEYLVLQIRIVNGIEEDWKVWGFTEESTPATIVEDEAYWRKQLSTQAAAVA